MLKKALMVTAVIAAFGVTAVMAGGHGHHGKGMERLTDKLNLTQVQQDQLKNFHQNQRTKRQTMMETTRTQIATHLTPDQAAQFTQWAEKRKQRMEKRANGERPDRTERGERKHRKGRMCDKGQKVDRHLNRLSKKLGLTVQQQSAIRPILENVNTQRQQFKQEREQFMQSILVGEQVTQFQEMKQKREARKQKRMERCQQS